MAKEVICHSVQFGQIQVNAISGTSGIFIGNNQAAWWRSQVKSNYGIGAGTDNRICNNINVVVDNDLIDSPILEQTWVHSHRHPAGAVLVDVRFDSINVDSINSVSAISIGENEQNAWNVHGKYNEGEGSFFGNTVVLNNINTIFDEDMVDSPIHVEKSTRQDRHS